MQVGEDAARMRIGRALEKLRRFFLRRGASSTGSIIVGAITTSSAQAVPSAMVMTITTVALVKGAAAGSSTLTLIKGALKIMPWTEPGRAIATGWRIIRPATIMNRAAFRLPTGMWRGIGGWGRRC